MEESETILSEELPNRKKVFIPIAIILVLIVGALMAVKASVHKEARLATQPLELTEGAEVPNFELSKLDGGKVQIGDISSKVMMINFWATWCEACMEEMPSIVTLRDQYSSKGFEVLGINVDENPTEVTPPVVKKLGIKFPIFTDSGNNLAELFDVHAIPLTVIINKSRKILLVEPGGRDWNTDDMHQLLDKWVND
jgi:peroxiredoxin